MVIFPRSLSVSGLGVTITGVLVRVGQALFHQNFSLRFS